MMGIRLRISDHDEYGYDRFKLSYREHSILQDVCDGWFDYEDSPVMWRLFMDRLFHDTLEHENCPAELVLIPDEGLPAWTLKVELEAILKTLSLEDQREKLEHALRIVQRLCAVEAARARLGNDIAFLKGMGLDYQDLNALWSRLLEQSEQ